MKKVQVIPHLRVTLICALKSPKVDKSIPNISLNFNMKNGYQRVLYTPYTGTFAEEKRMRNREKNFSYYSYTVSVIGFQRMWNKRRLHTN